jgi:hypothetical protein
VFRPLGPQNADSRPLRETLADVTSCPGPAFPRLRRPEDVDYEND